MPRSVNLTSPDAKAKQAGEAVTWIDLDLEQPGDIDWLAREASLSDAAKELMTAPLKLSRREYLEDGVFLGLQAPQSSHSFDQDELVDLKLLITPDSLISAHPGTVAAMASLHEAIGRNQKPMSPVGLLGLMIAQMTRRFEVMVFDIVTETDAAEDGFLDQGRMPSMPDLNRLRRRIFQLLRQVKTGKLLLAPLATDPALDLSSDDRLILARSIDHIGRYLDSLEDCRARGQMLNDLIEGEWAKVMTRSNVKLTLVATVFLPLTFVSGLLGMNVAGIPSAHNPMGFWVVTGLLVVFASVVWGVLHRRMKQLERTFGQGALDPECANREPGELS
jgi:zinc transporter